MGLAFKAKLLFLYTPNIVEPVPDKLVKNAPEFNKLFLILPISGYVDITKFSKSFEYKSQSKSLEKLRNLYGFIFISYYFLGFNLFFIGFFLDSLWIQIMMRFL